jgi:hypothetical protein
MVDSAMGCGGRFLALREARMPYWRWILLVVIFVLFVFIEARLPVMPVG